MDDSAVRENLKIAAQADVAGREPGLRVRGCGNEDECQKSMAKPVS